MSQNDQENNVALFEAIFKNHAVHLPTMDRVKELEDAGDIVQAAVTLDPSLFGKPFACYANDPTGEPARYLIVAGEWGWIALPRYGEDENLVIRPLIFSANYKSLVNDPYNYDDNGDFRGVEESVFPEYPTIVAGCMLVGLSVVKFLGFLDTISTDTFAEIQQSMHQEYSDLVGVADIAIHRLNGSQNIDLYPPMDLEYP